MPHDQRSPVGQQVRLLHEELTRQILGAVYSVYRELGGGFTESVYEAAPAKELIGMYRADVLRRHRITIGIIGVWRPQPMFVQSD
jgi:hypothetical protein